MIGFTTSTFLCAGAGGLLAALYCGLAYHWLPVSADIDRMRAAIYQALRLTHYRYSLESWTFYSWATFAGIIVGGAAAAYVYRLAERWSAEVRERLPSPIE
jgi:hypothetical protein